MKRFVYLGAAVATLVIAVTAWLATAPEAAPESTLPRMATTWEKYHAKGYDMLAVAMRYDPPAYVVNFAETRKLPFSVAIDNTGAVAKAWGDVQLTPTSFLVNKKGQIVKRYIGEPDFAELHRLIEKLLAEA